MSKNEGAPKNFLYRAFGFNASVHNLRTEIVAGITAFLTMSYLLTANPAILSAAGMPADQVFTTTALSAAICSIIMAVYAKTPLMLAPGMSINAFFAFTICGVLGFSFPEALTAVLISGVLFLLISLFGVREMIVSHIPHSLRMSLVVGMGFFITLVGLKTSGIIVSNEDTLLALADWSPDTMLAVFSLILCATLMGRGSKTAILISIIVTTLVGIPLGITHLPEDVSFFSLPALPRDIAFRFAIPDGERIVQFSLVVFVLLMMDIFDTLGTIVAITTKQNVTEGDELQHHMDRIFAVDAASTVIGSTLGTSTIATYIESMAGVLSGGRTGITALTGALFFLLALFCSPLFLLIPASATSGAIIMIGSLWIGNALKIKLKDASESLPCFIIVVMMAYTYSIYEGIMMGIITYVVINILSRKWKNVDPTLYVLAFTFACQYALVSMDVLKNNDVASVRTSEEISQAVQSSTATVLTEASHDVSDYIIFGLAALMALLIIVAMRLQFNAVNHKRLAAEKSAESILRVTKMKNAFMESMAHEVRTPLNAISGFSEILTSDMADLISEEERQQAQRMIFDNTQKLTAILNDMIVMSQMESGVFNTTLVEQNVRTMCQEVACTLEGRAGVDVTVAEKELIVVTDRALIQQMLCQLVKNGLKFTEQGHVHVDFETFMEEDQKWFRLSVEDTGIGVSTDISDRIFERFFKGDEFTQGTGMGLAVCHDVAQLLGGRIYLDQTYTQGARFVFEQPVEG